MIAGGGRRGLRADESPSRLPGRRAGPGRSLTERHLSGTGPQLRHAGHASPADHGRGQGPSGGPGQRGRRSVPANAFMAGHCRTRCGRNAMSTRRWPCRFPFRIRPTRDRCQCGRSLRAADPKTRPARVAATALARTATPPPALPAATGGGGAGALATPGSTQPSRPDRRRQFRAADRPGIGFGRRRG